VNPPDDCLQTLRVLGHELRRPLTVIRGASTLLVDDGDRIPAETRQQMLGLIDGSAAAMAETIEDILVAVHLEIGDVGYSVVPAALGPLIAEAVAAARRLDPERTIEVAGAADLDVEADPAQAVRALRALVANAVQHSPAGTPVEVSVRDDPDAVRVVVLDRGPGIPDGQRERAFEKFTRLDERSSGAGIGLYLARGLARAMGGDVTFGEREEGGAAVCFTLRHRG
jgi:signal transduction histidine kinase